MATFTYTFCTISQVLKNGGEIGFERLADILMQQEPQRFRDKKTVEMAVLKYTSCLIFDGGTVRFNKGAKRYAKYDIMERDVQAYLHGAVPGMDNWALYPFKTRKNSDTCYLGIPWGEIPKDPDEEKYNMNYPKGCDFRGEGEDSCRTGCMASKEVLRKYGLG